MPLWWRRRWRHVKLHVEFREGHVRLCEMEEGTERGEERGGDRKGGREGRGQKGEKRGRGGDRKGGREGGEGTERGEEREGRGQKGGKRGEGKDRRWLLCLLLRSHERLFLWSHECLPVVS